MGIHLYPVCHRGRDDCDPIQCITSEPPDLDDETYYSSDFVPLSFVCCGRAHNPELLQDQYRLCFKNDATDEMSDNDMQDLTSLMVVISAAMNFDAITKVNDGIVEIPASQAVEMHE